MTMFNGKKIRKLAQYSSCELSLHKKTKLFYMSFFFRKHTVLRPCIKHFIVVTRVGMRRKNEETIFFSFFNEKKTNLAEMMIMISLELQSI